VDLFEQGLENEWLRRLGEQGARLTGPRRAIVRILARSRRALEPLELYDAVRREVPGVGLVTVYRTLEALEELGLVQRIHESGGCRRYLRAPQGHQHVLLCRRCGQAELFDGDDLEPLFEQVAARWGYHIEEHWLQLFGLCPECQKANP
jgi:Fe2+ or Zn2+ uptake regulation protein